MLSCEGSMSGQKDECATEVTCGVAAPGPSRRPRRHTQGFSSPRNPESVRRRKANQEACVTASPHKWGCACGKPGHGYRELSMVMPSAQGIFLDVCDGHFPERPAYQPNTH